MTKNCTPLKNSFPQQIIRKILLTVLLLFMLTGSAQQTVRDSLEKIIRATELKSDFSTKDTLYISLLNKLGNELRYYNTDSLLHISKTALKYSNEVNYNSGKINSLIAIGIYYSDQGSHKKGIEYFKKALNVSKEIEDSKKIIRSQNNLSGEYTYLGDYAMALSGYLEAEELATTTANKKMLSIINENIANLYISQKDYTQGLFFFKKVKKINEELKNPIFSAETMSNMASAYADMGELDYAMFNINQSIAIFENKKIMDWLAYAYEIKGKIYLKQDKYKWALYWYKQSEMLHKSLQDVRGKISLLNGMSEAYLGQQKDSISQVYAINAFKLSKQLQFKEGLQECAKILYKINKNKKDYEQALTYHELFQKISDTLSRKENQTSLTMLKTKVEHERQKEELILSSEKAIAKQKNYVYYALSILLIFIIITFIIKRNEKIQKKLNLELNTKKKDLEKKEINLREINSTKDKLFSIIGHDLRGPIGAFQGLLKLFKDGEIGQEDFLGFVPKLKSDIDHISFTLNNLLSWGQSQMNGAVLKPSEVCLENLVSENINLLSETAHTKSINLINQLPPKTYSWADKNQIDIVIRNLISNALKFTPEKGTITIGSMQKRNTWEIFVKDTGVGMSVNMQETIFNKNSNVTTYGTNNEKGTGLGLSLCKEMVEKNGGKIWVTSTLGKGSCFYFTVPKTKKEYKQIA
ncbi:tetratricopeptide repeat-containing sensor histidine kinase [uncultured Maribacter sp.]|uniref:tetratricopeptide repeat-containing sensor histidine kinase n=1 Tax=uncultured Maribacter sp. TaxID=431308 RepID=UPI00262EF57A|nr:tetratricopeptide repeat-containing sensor histidine kinase [uncultured Maribacter sp.]